MNEEPFEHADLTEDQAQLLVSPIRGEIIMGLITLDRASVNELAAHLGRSPKALYHHLRPMVAAGLVVQVDTRQSGARTEAVYAPMARGLRLPKRLMPKGIESGLKLAIREAKSRPPNATQYIRMGARLSEEDVETLRTKLREVCDWAESRNLSTGIRVAGSIVVTVLETAEG